MFYLHRRKWKRINHPSLFRTALKCEDRRGGACFVHIDGNSTPSLVVLVTLNVFCFKPKSVFQQSSTSNCEGKIKLSVSVSTAPISL